MRKQLRLLLLLLPFLVTACNKMDNNPWRGKDVIPDPSVITKVDKPLGELQDGITRIDEKTLAFVLHAPLNDNVYLVGDFNNWTANDEYKLEKEGERFYIYLTNFNEQKEYACQYLVDERIRIADPYATKILDSNDKSISSEIYPNLYPYPAEAQNEIAMAVSTKENTFNWAVQNFKIEQPNNMVIYELLIRDFTEARSIKAVQEKLPYLKELGVTAIELLPTNEFEGNNSWGYNPSYFFATDKAYGTEQAYKEFIDACHQNGIGVIIDLVLNHAFDQCALVKLAKDKNGQMIEGNPWFNTKSPNALYHWGQDFNHESQVTKDFVDRVCAYWLTEFNVDGIRFDFTKGFTNTVSEDGWEYDQSRIDILTRMNAKIKEVNADAVVIFEHLTADGEEKVLANEGIYLWGNMSSGYSESTMGYERNDLSSTSYKAKGWSTPHLVSYMESHDEERLMFKNLAYGKEFGDYSCKDLNTALVRAEAAAAIFLSVPGPKMIWQFGERGYDESIDSFGGRTDPKPPYWEYMDNANRKALYDGYASLIKLKNENPAFQTENFNAEIGEGFVKKVALYHPSGSVFTVANFDVVAQTVTVDFDKQGNWVDFKTGETISTSNQATFELAPGAYKVLLQK